MLARAEDAPAGAIRRRPHVIETARDAKDANSLAEGSKVMMLVYNLHDPEEIYQRFAGVDGSAYLVGGVGVTFQKNEHIAIAPIRSGVGLRFGANIGYLKYTRRPTWNPF